MCKPFCSYPFIQLNITPYVITPCCATYYDEKTKNDTMYRSMLFNVAWNSPAWIKFREKILHDDYSSCQNCTIYKNANSRFITIDQFSKKYPEYKNAMIDAFKTGHYNIKYPYILELSFDPTCSLKCITCRDDIINNNYTDNRTVSVHNDFIYNKLFDYYKNVNGLIIGGDGDSFTSKHYLNILKTDLSKYKLKFINIMTNAQNFNENTFNKIHPNNIPLLNKISISIDAINKETYEKVRRNAKYDILLNNLKFCHKLLLDGTIKKLHSTFTISKENVNEILEFPDKYIPYGFTSFEFNFADFWDFRCKDDSYVIPLNKRSDIIETINQLKLRTDVDIH